MRALLESQKKINSKLVADGFFEESDVEAMHDKINVYMFQLDRMRHSAGAAWGLLAEDLQVPVLSEHRTIQDLRGRLSEVGGWASVDEQAREPPSSVPSRPRPRQAPSQAISVPQVSDAPSSPTQLNPGTTTRPKP